MGWTLGTAHRKYPKPLVAGKAVSQTRVPRCQGRPFYGARGLGPRLVGTSLVREGNPTGRLYVY